MSTHDYGLSVDDLRVIAKSLEQWQRLLISKDGEWQPRAVLIKRIEITRPDDESEVIGHFELDDGWVSFVPQGWVNR